LSVDDTEGSEISVVFTVLPPVYIQPQITGITVLDVTADTSLTAQNGADYEESEFNFRVGVTGSYTDVQYTLTTNSADSSAATYVQSTFTTVPGAAPEFWVFGVSGSNPNGEPIPVGEYVLTVKAVAPEGATNSAGNAIIDADFQVTFNIIPVDVSFAVQEFRIFNSTGNNDLGALEEGQILTLSSVEDFRTFVAVVDSTGETQSVRLQLSGPVSRTTTENDAPYSLFGDSGGNYDGSNLTVGSYTLTATPYNEPEASGNSGNPLTINFTVQQPAVEVGPPITNIFLVNLSSGRTDVRVLGNNDTINKDVVTYSWNLRAQTENEETVTLSACSGASLRENMRQKWSFSAFFLRTPPKGKSVHNFFDEVYYYPSTPR
jgi:hypothetical protein